MHIRGQLSLNIVNRQSIELRTWLSILVPCIHILTLSSGIYEPSLGDLTYVRPRFKSVPSLKMAPKFKSPNPNLSISCFINPCQLFHHRSSDSRTVNMTLIQYDLLWPPMTWENFLTLWTCCIKFFPKHISRDTLICVESMLLTRVPWEPFHGLWTNSDLGW